MISEFKYETKRVMILHILIMLISSLAYNHSILRVRKKSLFSLNMSSSTIVYDSYVMRSLLSRIEENNIVDPGEWGVFVPFIIKGKPYGYLKNEFTEKLTEFNNLFDLQRGTTSTKKLILRNEIDSLHLKEKSEAFSEMTKLLRNRGLIKGWRNELLPVVDNYSDEPVLLIERAAYPWFGIKGYGVHVNGYITESTSSSVPSKLWVAKRSKTKSTCPRMLDHIVAGALPHNISPLENVIKECAEEANIPREIAVKAKPVGAVSYRGSDEFGCLKRDTLICFDLKLPVL